MTSNNPSQESEYEYSKGGSRIHKHEGDVFNKPAIGVPERDHFPYQQQREKVYESMFGKAESVYHEVLPLVPHIDVYVHSPNETRPFYTLVTGGMSNLRMTLPEGIPDEYARAELVFYSADDKLEYTEVLRKLAHFPHDNATWLGEGHTLPNGNPPGPIFGSAVLDTFLFIPSIIRQPDGMLAEHLLLDGDPVNLLWVVPISTPECQFKLNQGTAELYASLDEKGHPVIFDPERASYV